MSSEDWEGFRQDALASRKSRQEYNRDAVEWLAGYLDFEVKRMQDWHLRVSQEGKKTLDYFPTSGKATWVGSGIFFRIANLEQFFTKHFKN